MSDETRNEDEALAAVVQKWRNMGHANRDDVSRLCDAAAELSSVRAEAERLRDGYGLQRQWADAQTERANQAVVERDTARAELAEVRALIERVALSWVDSRRESFSAVELDCAQEILAALAAVGSGDTEPATETAMYDLRCPNCGASASLPLGMTCSDHRPVRYPAAPAVGETKDGQR